MLQLTIFDGKNLVENLVVVFLMMTASLRIIISLYLDTV